jgi:hypothetical protein
VFRSQPELALPRHSLPEQLRLDQRVTFPVHSAANRQVAVDRVPPAFAHLVVLARRAAVVPEHRAALVHLQVAVRSAVAAAVVAQAAAAAAAQTQSTLSS